ncbi:hypothetical protein LTS18_003586 [Coniosporium uncinatum]|uniref:Uncharacterized protein n=1 Tax=Coniosporium uncinatum TaxID=93489 RepID=A0ACC3DT13_9PEZI|nr:hypothetical protein LTS18_003586 [Coniosporium uncinatum]
MASRAVGALFDIEHERSKVIADPPAILQKPAAKTPQSPQVYELDELHWGKQYNGPDSPGAGPSVPETPGANHTPKTPNELEMSHPSSPRSVAELVPSFWNPPMNKWRVAACCLAYLGQGLADSAPGALLPYIETHYSIGYAIVSLIFVANAGGFLIAATFTDFLHDRVGRAKTLMLAELIIIAANVAIVCTPPYPVVVVAFLLLGIGFAMILALNNVFCANLAGSTVVLGIAHGTYGVGGILGPIVATALVSNGVLWSRFYLIALAWRVMCFFASGFANWGYENEQPTQLLHALEHTASRRLQAEEGSRSKWQLFLQASKDRTTLFGALFIFTYQGAEVAISGWVISFLISYRNGDPAHVGYVTAGFWGGITLGRFVLAPFAARIGEKRFVYGLGAGAIAFQLLVWFIPNVIGNAVAVSVVGLLLGPIYPCSMTVFTRLLSRNIQMTSISFIAAVGSSGGAVMPFMTGLIAQSTGTYVLHPVCIASFVAMLGCWFGLPKMVKRTE